MKVRQAGCQLVVFLNPSLKSECDTMTELPQNLDEMNFYKSTDHKKYGWAATGCGVRIKL